MAITFTSRRTLLPGPGAVDVLAPAAVTVAGDRIVASRELYGGTYSLFTRIGARFGVSAARTAATFKLAPINSNGIHLIISFPSVHPRSASTAQRQSHSRTAQAKRIFCRAANHLSQPGRCRKVCGLFGLFDV